MTCRYSLALTIVALLATFHTPQARLAKQASVGADVAATESDVGYDSRYARGGEGCVNPLTGTPTHQVNLLSISSKSGLTYSVNLSYAGSVEGQVAMDNTAAPTGIAGLGWNLACEAIFVDSKSTVDMSDDEYFIRGADGAISQMVRQGTSNTYQLRNNPYLKAAAHYDGSQRLDGWTVAHTDGTQYKYGWTSGSNGALRNVNYNGAYFGCGTAIFYYQWDLASIEDVNGGKLSFRYVQDRRPSCDDVTVPEVCDPDEKYGYRGWCDGYDEPNTDVYHYYGEQTGYHFKDRAEFESEWTWEHGEYYNSSTDAWITTMPEPAMLQRMYFKRIWGGMGDWGICPQWWYYLCRRAYTANYGGQYTLNSHLLEIDSDNGDRLVFYWGGKDAATELGVRTLHEDADYLLHVDLAGRGKAALSYTGDLGQVPSLYAGVPAHEKRLLTGITWPMSDGAANRIFEYDRGSHTGFLKSVIYPMVGKRTVYDYRTQACHRRSDNAEFSATVVSKVTQQGGTGSGPDVVTEYTYSTDPANQEFDTSGAIAYWGKVAQSNSSGSVVTTFELDKATNKFGTVKSTEQYSTGSKLVAKNQYEYATKQYGPTGGEWYEPFMTKVTTTVNGVTTVSGTPLLRTNDNNGMPAEAYARSSDGTYLVTTKRFAYEDHVADMGNGTGGKNMLSQIASTMIYHCTTYDPATCDVSAGKVVQASYTVWDDATVGVGGSAVWRPSASYAWNVAMNSSGLPAQDFVAFSESQPTANGWQLVGKSEKYDAYGNMLQASDAFGVPAATLYGTPYNLPVATAANAKHSECFFSSFEIAAEWPSVNVTTAKAESGQHSALTVGAGYWPSPTKTFDVPLAADKEFTYSGWVYTTGPNAEIHLVANKPGSDALVSIVPAPDGSAGRWVLLQKKVTVPSGSTDFTVRLYNMGPKNGQNVVYFDDIRAHPSASLMAVTYYDPVWRTPILTVDANGNSGRLTELDAYGRPVKWYSQRTDQNGARILVAKREYHLPGALAVGEKIRLLTPNGGENLCVGFPYAIKWTAAAGTGDVRVYLSTNGGSDFSKPFGPLPSTTGGYVWTVALPAGLSSCTQCVIKLEVEGGSDASDAPFSVANYLTVTSPTSGETWWTGRRNVLPWSNPHPIRWSIDGGTDANVRIDYCDGAVWRPITTSTPNDGAFGWVAVAGEASPSYSCIRISDAVTGGATHESGQFYLHSNHGFVRRIP